MEKDPIYEALKEIFISSFELKADSIAPDKRLDNDLDLDSLDIADLIITLEDRMKKNIDPALFKDARTMQDLVNTIKPLWE